MAFDAGDAGDELFYLLEKFFADDVVGGERELEIPDVSQVCLGPGGLGSMVVVEAAEQG